MSGGAKVTALKAKRGKHGTQITTSIEDGALPRFLFSPTAKVLARPASDSDAFLLCSILGGLVFAFEGSSKRPKWVFRVTGSLTSEARVCGTDKRVPTWKIRSQLRKATDLRVLALEEGLIWGAGGKRSSRISKSQGKLLRAAFQDLTKADGFRATKRLVPLPVASEPAGMSAEWKQAIEKVRGYLVAKKSKAPVFFVPAPKLGWVSGLRWRTQRIKNAETDVRLALKTHGYFTRFVSLFGSIYDSVATIRFPDGMNNIPALYDYTQSSFENKSGSKVTLKEDAGAEQKAIKTAESRYKKRSKAAYDWLVKHHAVVAREAILTLTGKSYEKAMGSSAELLRHLPKDKKALTRLGVATGAKALRDAGAFKPQGDNLFVNLFGLAYSAEIQAQKFLKVGNAVLAHAGRERKQAVEIIESLTGEDLKRVTKKIAGKPVDQFRFKSQQTLQKIGLAWGSTINALNLVAYFQMKAPKTQDTLYAAQSIVDLAGAAATLAALGHKAKQEALGLADEFAAIGDSHGWGKGAKWLGKGAGVIGAVVKGVDLVEAIDKGDTTGAIFSGIDLGASIMTLMMSNPVTAVAGAVILTLSGVFKSMVKMFADHAAVSGLKRHWDKRSPISYVYYRDHYSTEEELGRANQLFAKEFKKRKIKGKRERARTLVQNADYPLAFWTRGQTAKDRMRCSLFLLGLIDHLDTALPKSPDTTKWIRSVREAATSLAKG